MCMEAVIIRALLSHVAEINIFRIFPLLVSRNYFVSSIEQLKKKDESLITYIHTCVSITYCFLSLHFLRIFWVFIVIYFLPGSESLIILRRDS